MKLTVNSAQRLLFPAFVLFCLLPTHSAAAPDAASSQLGAVTIQGLPVIVRGNSATLKASASIDEDTDKPAFSGDAVTPFTALLKAYPHARFVCIAWEDANILNFGGAHVLYDRLKHTLTVASYNGGQGDATFGEEVRFTSVRESVFAAIVNAHPKGVPEADPETEKIAEAHTDSDTSWDGFQLLYQHRYGCHSYVVRARRKVGPLRAMSR
jgi:hypothetical protein